MNGMPYQTKHLLLKDDYNEFASFFSRAKGEEWAAIEINATGCHALESSPEKYQQGPRPFL